MARLAGTDRYLHVKAKIPCPPDVDPCRAASCSLMASRVAAEKLLKLPRYRKGSVACLHIPKGSGKARKKKQHIDFWAFSGFDFVSSITVDVND